MTTAIFVEKGSIRGSKKTSIFGNLTLERGAYGVKSGSFYLGYMKQGSVVIDSVGDGFVNTGFVEGNSAEYVSGDSGLPRMKRFFDGQQGKNKKVGNISMMLTRTLEEQRRGWPFTNQRTEAGETQLENISAGKNEQNNTQTPSEEMTSKDVSKKTDNLKLSTRDYLMALSVFYITFVIYGNMEALSVLTVEWIKEFPNSKSLILFVPNLSLSLMSAIGIIDGILINRFGIYKIIILGCFLKTTCILGSSFSTNAITLVIVLGFLLGFASCFTCLNSFIVMAIQFGDAGKSFLTALSFAAPLSGLVFSNLIPVFIEMYTWKGNMYMLAAINLQMIPLSLFLFLSHKHKKRKCIYSKAEPAGPISLPTSKKSFDVSVIKDPLFLAYMCALVFTMSGIIMMNSLLPSFLYKKGLSLKEAAAIYSIYKSVSVLPRILIGLIQRWFPIRFIHMYIGLASFFGFMHILIPLAETHTTLFVSCIFLSLGMGAPSGLYNIGILECLGPEKYSVGASINETTYGISSAIFGYLASLLVEYMNAYQATFCIYGASIMASNLCLLITVIVQYKRRQKGSS